MNPSIVINDLNGRRSLSEQQLPLNIGAADDADIRLPSWVGQGSFAQISLLDDRCFVQPQNQHVELLLNGVSLVGTRWLDDGDVLTVGDADIALHNEGNHLELQVFYSSEEVETAPPLMPPSSYTGDAKSETGEAFATESERKIARASQPEYDDEADSGQQDNLSHDDEMVPLPVASAPESGDVEQELPEPKRRRLLVYLLWLLLPLAAAYIYFSAKVSITVTPDEARVRMLEPLKSPGGAGRFLLMPGRHDFVVEAPGYEPVQDTIEVGLQERQDLDYGLLEKPGRLMLDLPSNATGELWVDGERVAALSELPAELPKGQHDFRITTDLYEDFSGSIVITGRDALQTVPVELVPNWGSFAVSSQPDGATVFLGARRIGITPATIELPAGTHELEIRLAGYETLRQTVTAVAGQVEVLPLIMFGDAGGFVDIETNPPGVAVSIEGQFQGSTPLKIEVPRNEQVSLLLSKPGYDPVAQDIVLEGTEPVSVNVQMTPKIGAVTVEASPPDALLLVDGELVGLATQQLQLLAIEHQIEIRKEGYESMTTSVTPTPGVTKRIDVTLLTSDQARLEGLPLSLNSPSGQRFKLVTPGEFSLGTARSDPERGADEPLRQVRLQRPFYIGVTEVTNAQFRRFSPGHTSAAEKFAQLGAPNHPAVMLSWNAAAAYCNWLSDREGISRAYVMREGRLQLATPPNSGYRLPTEAEWAWVARFNAGQGERRFAWGSEMPPAVNAGNYADASAFEIVPNVLPDYDDSYAVTAPVGSFAPNPLGIHDLGGNVAEWVNDLYSVEASSSLLIDPVGPAQGQYRVIRGASWRHADASELRLATRSFGEAARMDVGFRLARYAPSDEVAETRLELIPELQEELVPGIEVDVNGSLTDE